MISRQSIPLGKILNIPIGLDYSWFLVFVLLTWSLAVSYYPSEFKAWSTGLDWAMGAVTAIMLFVSVLLHELGHSAVALRYKIPVRKITLFIFGGVAEISAEPPSASAEFWIAIAGPAVSFGLAVVFGILQRTFAGIGPLFGLAKYLAYINGALALFNLIPGFPLDGGRVLRSILWGASHNLHRSTIIAANVGRGIAFLFILLGVWLMFAGSFGNGLWIAFIGWFLESAAASQIQQQRLQDMLGGHTVGQAINLQTPPIVAPDMSVQELVDEHVLNNARRAVLVEHPDTGPGLVTLHHLQKVPKAEWPAATVDQISIPHSELRTVQANTDLWQALMEMDQEGVAQLPVMSGGKVVGMLSRGDLITFLSRMHELDGNT